MVYRNITYDDRDTTDIHYNEYWFITGSYNASSVGETGTLSSSLSPDAALTFTFPEPATGFYYYGMLRSGGGLYLICIDCDPNDRLWDRIDAHNASDDGRNPPALLYSKTWDNPGVHEVILQNTNDTRFNRYNTQITLDRFILTVEGDDADEPEATTASGSTSATSGSSATPLSSSTSSTPSTSSSATTAALPPRSKVNVGVIAGAVAGAVVFLAVTIALLWWCCRRRRQSRAETTPKDDRPRSPSQPLPYMKGRPPSLTTRSTTPGLSPFVGRDHPPSTGRKRAESDSRSPSTSSAPATRRPPVRKPPLATTNVEPSNSSVQDVRQQTPSEDASSSRRPFVVPRREIDAGPADDEVLEDVLPPDYDDATRHRRGA
ncbi:hypothetical protein EV714DRAFT_286917 [Schizophyllum commune]